LEYPGIDYGFRPRLGSDEKGVLHALLANARNAEERKTIIAYWEAGRIDALPEELARGKEAGGEQEIARLEGSALHLGDAISVRARRTPAGIRYRITDGSGAELAPARDGGTSPLTLRELIALIEGGVPVAKLEELGRIRSEPYPQLAEHYRRVLAAKRS